MQILFVFLMRRFIESREKVIGVASEEVISVRMRIL